MSSSYFVWLFCCYMWTVWHDNTPSRLRSSILSILIMLQPAVRNSNRNLCVKLWLCVAQSSRCELSVVQSYLPRSGRCAQFNSVLVCQSYDCAALMILVWVLVHSSASHLAAKKGANFCSPGERRCRCIFCQVYLAPSRDPSIRGRSQARVPRLLWVYWYPRLRGCLWSCEPRQEAQASGKPIPDPFILVTFSFTFVSRNAKQDIRSPRAKNSNGQLLHTRANGRRRKMKTQCFTLLNCSKKLLTIGCPKSWSGQRLCARGPQVTRGRS